MPKHQTNLVYCCAACHKQNMRTFLYTPAPGEDVWSHQWRIQSFGKNLEWADEPPCPRGFLICGRCNDLANCKMIGSKVVCGDCAKDIPE